MLRAEQAETRPNGVRRTTHSEGALRRVDWLPPPGDWAVGLPVRGYSGFAVQCNRGGREHDPRFRPCGSIELGSGAPVQFYQLVKAGGHL